MGALGGFAQGMGNGLMMGMDMKDRKADRELRDREITALEARGAAPQSDFPSWSPPPSYTPGAGGTPPLMPTDGSGGPRAARGAMPDFYTAERSADAGAKDNTFWGLLAKREGADNFSTLFGHSQKEGGKFAGVDVARMTIGQASEFAAPDGEYGQWVKGQVGRVATPMGAPQIVGTTLRRTAKAMGLSPDTPFDEGTQRDMATYLARQRIAQGKTPAARRAGLRAEWEGFKRVTDSDLDRVIQELGA